MFIINWNYNSIKVQLNDQSAFEQLFIKLSFNNEEWIIDVYIEKKLIRYISLIIREISSTEILMRVNNKSKKKIKMKDDDIK